MCDLVLARPGAASRAEAHWDANLPLGIGYLAAAARAAGFRVAVVDGRASRHSSIDETVASIIRHRPRVLGISALTVEFSRSAEIARRVKDTSPSTVTVLGGAHANALPAESLHECPGFDYVVAGEAERSLVELLRAVANCTLPTSITGLHQRNDCGGIDCHAPPRYDTDMATLPLPAWDLFPRSAVYPMMTERGCPYNCVFCSRNMSKRVRSRPMGHVMEEVHWLVRDFQAREIHIEDETFGLHADATGQLLEALAEFNHDGRVCFKAQTRADRMTPRFARQLRAAGFRYVEIGVESGDEAVLAAAEKGIDLAEIEASIRTLKEAGIKTWANFIIGLPGETRESVKRSTALAVRLNPHRLSVAIIVAYPGSEIFRWAQAGEHGYRLLTTDWDRFDKYLTPSVELDTLSYSTMRRLQLRMYFETYLRNLRFGDLTKLIWRSRSFVGPVVRSLLRGSAQSDQTG